MSTAIEQSIDPAGVNLRLADAGSVTGPLQCMAAESGGSASSSTMGAGASSLGGGGGGGASMAVVPAQGEPAAQVECPPASGITARGDQPDGCSKQP